MTSKKLKNRLTQFYIAPESSVGEAAFRKTLALAQEEVRQKQRRQRISFPRFLALQIRFLGWRVWAVQGSLLLTAAGVLRLFLGRPFWEDTHAAAELLFCLSMLVFLTAPPFLYRSVRYRMQEVEAAARFSSVKLLMARLILLGMGDLVLLLLLTAAARTATESPVFYVWLPFLLASGGCLFLLGHTSSRQFLAGSMGLCFLLTVLFSAADRLYRLPLPVSPVWTVLCLLLAVFCAQQLHYLMYHSPYAEMQVASL